MGPPINENKLQFDEKNWKVWKLFENVYHNPKTVRFELTASGNIICSILN